MINVTKLNGKEIILNCDLIETIESLPDTTITTTTGKKIIVKDSVDDIIDSIVKYKNKIFNSYR